jgi:hypothetical protein
MLPYLKELKHISEYQHRFDEFFKNDVNYNTDFDIYLNTYKRKLQRDYCWNDFQKQELISSILLCRHIPPITVVEYLNNNLQQNLTVKPKYQIIDGKQRLLTHKNFIDNEFFIEINEGKYFFKDLPNDYQNRILNHKYGSRFLKYDYFGDVSDEELIEFFKWCNFAGTQQEKDYLLNFKI